MGIEIVEGHDLVAHHSQIYMHTTAACGWWM
jgi:uncharacterized circularly permuted ATP-grasp superfamily protein